MTRNRERESQLTAGLLGRKKLQTQSDPSAEPIVLNKLQEITGLDTDMYRALSKLLFLDPKRISLSLEDAIAQASDFEAAGNTTRAEVLYRIAGGIALYKGDAGAVRKYFEKAASIAGGSKPEYATIAGRASEAVGLAQKYYENL